MNKSEIIDTKIFATKLRISMVRQFISAGNGHVGGAFSLAEIIAVLYQNILNINSKHPKDTNRDRVILSKGHASAALYSALALKGYFPADELDTCNHNGTHIPSHCDENKVPGVDFTTGSLGMGLSNGAGIAYGLKLNKIGSKVYVIVGDGELQEGQNWEALMCASKFKLDNLTCIVDSNKYQLDGSVENIMNIQNISDKFASFGWDVCIVDGHDVEKIYNTLKNHKGNKPFAVVADTVKGKGIASVENMKNYSHHMNVDKKLGQEYMNLLNKTLSDLEREKNEI